MLLNFSTEMPIHAERSSLRRPQLLDITSIFERTKQMSILTASITTPNPSLYSPLKEGSKRPETHTEQTTASSLVSLSANQAGVVLSSPQALSGIPLTVAWAPQMFSKAKSNATDDAISADDFSKQLGRIGTSSEEAAVIFNSFDVSKDGSVSLEEYATGVQSLSASGNNLFDRLLDSYTHDAAGSFSADALKAFLADGANEANAYWSDKR